MNLLPRHPAFRSSLVLATIAAALATACSVQEPAAVSIASPTPVVTQRPLAVAQHASPAPAPARFLLTGVVAMAGHPGQGMALVSVDGQREQAVRAGAVLAQGWTLHEVHEELALLLSADGGRQVLHVEARAPAPTGSVGHQRQEPSLPAASLAKPAEVPSALAVELANREMSAPASD
ncbi:hypothetical protein LZ009_16805 [Ramlibacter sp. XY19]|uniref:hypothetical protein n=1 Tax=Ramlibacter paludis TaxID=2908000 RepID=UPI0023DBE538|nr:hypothetical protein [Ramlibacter paludis]MCG2594439.1 hypothetical protein [Ramlibacter paludis]